MIGFSRSFWELIIFSPFCTQQREWEEARASVVQCARVLVFVRRNGGHEREFTEMSIGEARDDRRKDVGGLGSGVQWPSRARSRSSLGPGCTADHSSMARRCHRR
jgi:hypothetical protein